MNQFKNLLFSNVLIIGFVILCFWQVFFMKFMMQWDILDISLPWRNFVDQCIENRVLPTWNPFINNGFPQQADPQTWYPISAFLSLFGTYDLATLNFEYVFHLVIGGLGMRSFLITLGIERKEILIIGSLSYACSGFMVGNAQHLGWIVSSAWIPWILSSTYLFFKEYKVKTLLSLVLFMFFLLTGGYPGLFIVTSYFILAYFVLKSVQGFQQVNKAKLIISLVCSGLIFLGLSLIVLNASFEIQDHIYRSALSVEEVTDGSLSSRSLLSLVFPFIITSQGEFFGPLSISNTYFGFFTLLIIAYGFVSKRWTELAYFAIGLLFLLLALGEELPFRRWLYYLPFFDKFRFPSFFRLFFILFSIVSSMLILEKIDFKIERKQLQNGLVGILIVLLLCGFFTMEGAFQTLFRSEDLVNFIQSSTIKNRVFISIMYLIPLCTLLLIGIKRGGSILKFLVVIVLFEVFCATQLCAAKTVYMTNRSFEKAQSDIHSTVSGFPIPDLTNPYFDKNNKEKIEGLWRNVSTIRKRPSFYGYSPYYFNDTEKLETSDFRKKIHASGVLGFTNELTSDSLSLAYLNTEIEITSFSPNNIGAEVNSKNAGWLVYHQNLYPGWTVFVDGIESNIVKLNYCEIGVQLPIGKSNVEFVYKPKWTSILFFLSLIFFVGTIIAVVRVKNYSLIEKGQFNN